MLCGSSWLVGNFSVWKSRVEVERNVSEWKLSWVGETVSATLQPGRSQTTKKRRSQTKSARKKEVKPHEQLCKEFKEPLSAELHRALLALAEWPGSWFNHLDYLWPILYSSLQSGPDHILCQPDTLLRGGLSLVGINSKPLQESRWVRDSDFSVQWFCKIIENHQSEDRVLDFICWWGQTVSCASLVNGG